MRDHMRELTVERSTSTAHRLSQYDGVCNNFHGHNFEWEITLWVSMKGSGKTNMPLDFKDVSDLIDETDHATLLCIDDPMVKRVSEASNTDRVDAREIVEDLLGDVIWFETDPTCELVAQWMARRFVVEFDSVHHAHISIAETEKYTMTADYEKKEAVEIDDD